MAHAASFDLQEDLAGLRDRTRNIFNQKWLAKFVKNGCAH
jgi:hypothetical protein